MNDRKLTPKQEQFCREYMLDLNGTQAAIRAGYSSRTANEQSARLLANVSIQSYIQELMNRRSARTNISADTILTELHRLATVDISQAFDKNGGLLPIHEMPEDVRRAISAIDMQELFDGQGDQKHIYGQLKKVKFWDKTRSLEILAKHLKLLTDKVEHSGAVATAQVTPEQLADLINKQREHDRD